MNLPSRNIVLAGGGTGGHVIPAIAVAEALTQSGHRVCFVGTRDRLEARLVPAAGFEIRFIDARPLVGHDIATVMNGLVRTPLAVIQAVTQLRAVGAEAVLGVGGYVAGPVVLAARGLGLPTAVLEQNATLGLTNRLLAHLIDRAFVCYEPLLTEFKPGRAELTGNPLRSSMVSAP